MPPRTASTPHSQRESCGCLERGRERQAETGCKPATAFNLAANLWQLKGISNTLFIAVSININGTFMSHSLASFRLLCEQELKPKVRPHGEATQ